MTNDLGTFGSLGFSTLRTCVRFLTRFLTILDVVFLNGWKNLRYRKFGHSGAGDDLIGAVQGG